MGITVKTVCTKRELRKFIHLPAKIHKGHKNWIPPLYSDEWEFFSAEKNKSFEYSDVIMLLATRRKDLKPWIRPIFTLINDTFTEIYGFMPFTLEEMDDFANRYLLIMDPRLIKAVVNERNEAVAFVIGMPDISKGIKQSRGYLLPIGIIQILLSGRRSKQLNLLLGAIHPDYQNRGLDTIMGSAMLDSARKLKMEYIDSHLEMETNTKVRAEMEYMGGDVYKTYRVFGKTLQRITKKAATERIRQLAEAECG